MHRVPGRRSRPAASGDAGPAPRVAVRRSGPAGPSVHQAGRRARPGIRAGPPVLPIMAWAIQPLSGAPRLDSGWLPGDADSAAGPPVAAGKKNHLAAPGSHESRRLRAAACPAAQAGRARAGPPPTEADRARANHEFFSDDRPRDSAREFGPNFGPGPWLRWG